MWNVCGAMSAVLIGLNIANILVLEWWQILMPLFVAGLATIALIMGVAVVVSLLYKLEPQVLSDALDKSFKKVM